MKIKTRKNLFHRFEKRTNLVRSIWSTIKFLISLQTGAVFGLKCGVVADISSELWEKRAGNYGKIEQIETRNLHQ